MFRKILILSLLSLFCQNSVSFELNYTSQNDQSICSSLYEINQDVDITKDSYDNNSESNIDGSVFCVTSSLFPLSEGIVDAITNTQTPQDVEISLLVHKITEERNEVIVAKETMTWTSREAVINPEISVEVSAKSVDGYVTLLVRASDASSIAVKSISFHHKEDYQLIVPVTDDASLDEISRTLNPANTIAFPTVSDITITPAPVTIQFLNVTEIVTLPPQTPINTIPFPNVTEIVTKPPETPINTTPFPNVTEIVTDPPHTPINTIPFPNVTEIVTQPPQTLINTIPFPNVTEIVTEPPETPINTIPFPNVTEIVTKPPETPINTIPFPNVTEIVTEPPHTPINTIPFPNVTEIVTQPPQTPINTIPFPNVTEIVTEPPETPINTIPFPNVTEIVTQPPQTPINTVPFPTVGEIDFITEPTTDAPTEDEERDITDGLSSVAIVMIAIGSAVGVGIIGFALWYFVCKSKRANIN